MFVFPAGILQPRKASSSSTFNSALATGGPPPSSSFLFWSTPTYIDVYVHIFSSVYMPSPSSTSQQFFAIPPPHLFLFQPFFFRKMNAPAAVCLPCIHVLKCASFFFLNHHTLLRSISLCLRVWLVLIHSGRRICTDCPPFHLDIPKTDVYRKDTRSKPLKPPSKPRAYTMVHTSQTVCCFVLFFCVPCKVGTANVFKKGTHRWKMSKWHTVRLCCNS